MSPSNNTADFAHLYWASLQRPTLAKEQYRRGRGDAMTASYGYARRIGLDAIRKHLSGWHTLALSCVRSGHALFGVYDVDQFFRQRLPAFKRALTRKGLARAAFATEGTDADRGKVIVTFARPVPRDEAIAIMKDVLAEASSDHNFGPIHDIVMYPNMGSAAGNVVRIMGGNLKRGSGFPCEAALTLDGELTDLCDLEPAAIDPPPNHFRVPSYPGSDGTRKQTYEGGGNAVAGDALRMAWRCESEEAFNARCDEWCAGELTPGAREQLERADFRQRTWAKVQSRQQAPRENRTGPWQMLTDPPTGMSASSAPWRVYRAAAELAVRVGRNPHAFEITFGQWSDLVGYAEKPACGRAVVTAEKRGLLVRVDRGDQRRGGLATMITLVGQGETQQEAFDRALESDEFKKRAQDRATQRSFIRGNFMVDGNLVYAEATKPLRRDLEKAPAVAIIDGTELQVGSAA